MPDFLEKLLSADGYMPHGHCYLWNPDLIWLHVVSDALIALAYTSIPFTLVYFARRRKDIPFNWMFLCFGTFIVACGMTHVMEIVTLWTPLYWLSGIVKAITAAASVPTAILLARLVPHALRIPTATELERANEELRRAREELETRVDERTAELRAKNAELADQIAERRATEAALRKSDAMGAAVMEASLDAIVVMDATGNVADFNPAAAQIFGFDRDEVIGKPMADFLVPLVHRESHAAGMARYLATGNEKILGKRVELPARRKDGTEFPAEIAIVRIRADGPPIFTGTIRDVTERQKAAEAEVLRREKQAAEEANAELETFSYSVAHDLRAPLRGISGFASILADDYGPQLDETAREHLKRIRAGADRMSHLIDALLSLARLSRAELRRERVDLTALARSTVDQLRHDDGSRAVDVVIADDLVAEGDPHLLRSVLENLFGNAWKFTRGRAPAKIEFGTENDGTTRTFFVRDNGAGFDMTLARKLFTPFRRLHGEEQFEGTGIGLATVQRIVRRHGGRVWADASVGSGATFRFTLGAG